MKTYLAIGAGPGMSMATAERFAQEGFRVVLASRSGKSIASQVAALRKGGATVEMEIVDASDPKSVAVLVSRHAPDLAVLHYNVGILHYGPDGALQTRSIEEETVETLISEMQSDLVSALAAIKAGAEAMSPRREGTILVTGGGFGVDPTPAFLTLSTAKAGLRAAIKALFEPMKEKGIHIATVTVSTLIAGGSEKAAEAARAFWDLHTQAPGTWEWETVFK